MQGACAKRLMCWKVEPLIIQKEDWDFINVFYAMEEGLKQFNASGKI